MIPTTVVIMFCSALTEDATTAELTPGEIASLTLPDNIVNDISSNAPDVRAGYTVYRDTRLFPVREASTSNNQTIFVASVVVSAIVNGIPEGTQLSAPITVFLLLKNASLLNETNQTVTRNCVFWNFTAAG